MKRILPLAFIAVALAAGADTNPRTRPVTWAVPVIDTTLENCFRVSDELFRCEQPEAKDAADLKALGVRTLLNLRHRHSDPKALADAGFALLVERMEADEVTVDQLVAALRKFRDAPKPVMVHCWHGSDRTGVFVATYRIVFQGWNREAALDEFRFGSFGFHEKWFPNLLTLLGNLDEEALRRRVLE
jgi:tyrosine-protein phosphatase SIW14